MAESSGNDIGSLSIETITGKLSVLPGSVAGGSSGQVSAAVLLPLISKDGTWNLLFTLRTDKVKDHKGQVSFPGGVREVMDESLLQTALRESWEEIGLESKAIKILGSLPEFQSVTNYVIKPFVGMVRYYGPFIIEKKEVAKVFLVPLNWLADSNNWLLRNYDRGGGKIDKVIVYKPYNDQVIWGITAYIVQIFIRTLMG
jgi:8-oxo-dGTP pyrophosphatase MutT (NUDIX family)